MSAGEEKNFSLTGVLPIGCNPNNLEVLVYVQRPFGSQPRKQSHSYYGDYYVVNSRSAALGTEVELEFAD